MNKKMANKLAAQRAFNRQMVEVRKLLSKIRSGLDEYQMACDHDACGYNWAMVGDLDSFVDDLQDLSDRVHQEGEYAPDCSGLDNTRDWEHQQ